MPIFWIFGLFFSDLFGSWNLLFGSFLQYTFIALTISLPLLVVNSMK
jgi:hypothetical protein